MASNMVVFDPTKVRFEDIEQRRKIIQSHFEAIGWTNDEANHALHQSIVEYLCNMFHNRPEGFLKVGHVLFEWMVDQTIWKEIMKRRKEMGVPVIEWPWTRGPGEDDESMGISATYHEWRKRNGHELPKDEKPQSVLYRPQDQSRIMTRVMGGSAAAIAKSQASDKAFAEHIAEKLVLKREMDKMKKDCLAAFSLAMNNKSVAARVIFDEEVAKIKAGAAKKRKSPTSLAEKSDSPILPDPVTLPVRLISGLIFDPLVMQAKPTPWELRLRVWQTAMGQEMYEAPCIGPFEVALPTWLNFHDLIWGHGGRLYAELRSSLHRFLTVGWITTCGKPKSLVVDVVFWVSEVYAGTCTTLLESLTLSHWRRMFKNRRRQLPKALIDYLSDGRKYDTIEAEALKRCNEEEVWTPQIYAILNQHSVSAIAEPLRAWVWVVVAASNQNTIQIFQALEWEHNFISSLSQETNTAAAK
ncbi:uncharacterized protein B0J16DRAFT_386953 [Fusarium flagelliforme]|uniref:uncharacterized protein n=1 Tax=Fusarium flagelliforme TaxID=2675880 RepID=UPI001E8D5A06|nr:uncharacterized protein B0J16DRAFT_386953 [Fusarium flagelliforme]KAH7179129.1 hypothetical protein B0J16DRAFT_386953 [Fusarium flagelliforme]